MVICRSSVSVVSLNSSVSEHQGSEPWNCASLRMRDEHRNVLNTLETFEPCTSVTLPHLSLLSPPTALHFIVFHYYCLLRAFVFSAF